MAAARTGLDAYWSRSPGEVAAQLESGEAGLSSAQAAQRLAEFGPNEIREQRGLSRSRALWNQLRSPLLLLLVFAAGASAVTGEWFDALLVLAIVCASVLIGYSREYRAQTAAAELRGRIQARATVVRDGQARVIPLREVVPGDTVQLSAGSLVPGDGVILESTDLFVNEAVLTGESFPALKQPGIAPPSAPVANRANCVFLGTNVRSGTARCLIVHTGLRTQFGAIARRLSLRPPETEFDRGIRRFGYLLTSTMLIIVVTVFAANVVIDRPPVQTLLFSVALAVGLSPELLPALLSVNLARGAQMMARHGVVVRHLNAIENLGSMDVLCTDKTGTLTEGVVRLDGAWDVRGQPSDDVLELAVLNARLQTGLVNPLDEAILNARSPTGRAVTKLAEIPYDFVRKRLSVVIRGSSGIRLITKGAVDHVLPLCVQTSDGEPLEPPARRALQERVHEWSHKGIRVLAVATRSLEPREVYGREDERDLEIAGFLTFLDRPKEGAAHAIGELRKRGVTVKLISGDSLLVCRHVAALVGIPADRLLTGRNLDELHDEALWQAAEQTQIFAEVDPNQKERIILSIKKTGHVVGFLGDGVNDAPAMHAADTSLSVEQAADVARESADFVLLQRDLDVVRRGIDAGRRTFANTLKYVLLTTSANLGNMLSMAVASLFLPFLPLLPAQILLNNLLSDIPAIGLADDRVDRELVARPGRWDMRFIGRFMVQFGMLSSLFDLLTFAALAVLFAAGAELFRTGWFVESLLTELLIALVVRTRRPFFRSRPAALLLVLTLGITALALCLPYLPAAGFFGFVPVPPDILVVLVLISIAYVAAAEIVKLRFYRNAAGP